MSIDFSFLVGKTKDDAIQSLKDLHINYRIGSEDDVVNVFPAVLWKGVYLRVEDGIVVRARHN